MILRVPKDTADRYIAEHRQLEYKGVDVLMIGHNRFYLADNATEFEMQLFIKEWQDSIDGAELPSFKFDEEVRI